jgi:hypothetical protein
VWSVRWPPRAGRPSSSLSRRSAFPRWVRRRSRLRPIIHGHNSPARCGNPAFAYPLRVGVKLRRSHS